MNLDLANARPTKVDLLKLLICDNTKTTENRDLSALKQLIKLSSGNW